MKPEVDAPHERRALEIRSARHYPLNSKRLTATHLRTIAEALKIPTAGSVDQLRQCIEGKLATEREDPNVVVIINECLSGEAILALADSEGEFLENLRIAARREQSTSAAAVRVTDEVGDMAKELQEVRCQLEKVTLAWESALAREAEQKGELQAVLRDREEMAYSFTAEIETLQQALSDEKLKTKRNWKINCEYLMEQDHVLTEKEEEIQNLQQQLAKLSERTSEDKRATDSPSHLSEVRTIDDVVSGRSSLPHDAVGTGKEVMRDGTSGETTHSVLLVDSIASTTKSRVTAAGHLGEHSMVVTPTTPEPRRGKAPPIAFFSGDDPALLLDDWIPSLERAAQ